MDAEDLDAQAYGPLREIPDEAELLAVIQVASR
jgi:hypothetical protein